MESDYTYNPEGMAAAGSLLYGNLPVTVSGSTMAPHGVRLHRVIRQEWQQQVRSSMETSPVTVSGSTTAPHGVRLHRVIRQAWQQQVRSSMETSPVTVSGSTMAPHGASLHRVIRKAWQQQVLSSTETYGNGIWQYNGTTWSQVTPGNPRSYGSSGFFSSTETSDRQRYLAVQRHHMESDYTGRSGSDGSAMVDCKVVGCHPGF